MHINWRKINRAIHRDLGYFFTGMVIIYALSGIALNHLDDWDPSYKVDTSETTLEIPSGFDDDEKAAVDKILAQTEVRAGYQNHYMPDDETLKIFLERGSSVVIDMDTGEATVERVRRRPVFYEVNFLHYNPGALWAWFSDAFAVGLIILAISGLFILEGKNGIKGRGVRIAAAGIIIPLIFLLLYL
ncbi:MAG: PepSY-associated TM helix domain-containing protein [Marinilabilia sp.]